MNRENLLISFMGSTEPYSGEYWECGTFQGDCVHVVRSAYDNSERTFRLFDTFSGQPFSGPFDVHQVGSMNETSYDLVYDKFSGFKNVFIHSGVIPNTFSGLENSNISVVNIDVDNYDSVKACLEFVYPRVHPGGCIMLDDYGCGDCPGAKIATDNFLLDKPEQLIHTGSERVYFIKQ